MINVREATAADIVHFITLGRTFAALAGEPFDRDSAGAHMDWILENDDAVAFLATDIEGKAVGVAGAMCFPTLWDSSKLLATELWWYVAPEARNDGVGAALMDALESWAQEAGAYRLLMLSIVGLTDGIEKAYIKRGYVAHEQSYMKEF